MGILCKEQKKNIMKKLFVIALLLGMVHVARAEFPLSLGIKAGYNSSTFTIDKLMTIYNEGVAYDLGDVRSEMRNGFNVGLFARIQKDRLFLQPEAYVAVRKGGIRMDVSTKSVLTTGEVDFVTQNIELSTLDIPLLVGYRLINTDLIKLSVFTGPAASIVLNEKVEFRPSFLLGSEGASVEGISVGTDVVDNFDPEEEFTQANWNWQAGIGVDISFLTADVRYEWGLNDINTLDFVQKTNMLTFTLGIKLF